MQSTYQMQTTLSDGIVDGENEERMLSAVSEACSREVLLATSPYLHAVRLFQ